MSRDEIRAGFRALARTVDTDTPNPPTTAEEIRRRREARGAADPLNRLRARAAGAEPITEQRP